MIEEGVKGSAWLRRHFSMSSIVRMLPLKAMEASSYLV
jgi:hypothetical protein